MENEILENVINNTEEVIEEQFEMMDIPEIKTKQVVITGKFNCQSFPLGRYEKTTVINDEGIEEIKEVFIPLPHLIEITEEELAQIDPLNGTKCFDIEHDCVVDYDNTEYSKMHKLEELRAKRAVECFTIINRGQLWYDTLTKVQKEELQVWYKAWLDVTETMEEPIVPEFLLEELERFYIVKEEPVAEEVVDEHLTEDVVEESADSELVEETPIEETIEQEVTEDEEN